MADTDNAQLADALMALVPADGSTIGNVKLRSLLAESLGQELDESDYFAVQQALVEQGVLIKGRGRGGSVKRAHPISGDRLILDAQEIPEAAKQPKPQQAGLLNHPKQPGQPTRARRATHPDEKVLAYRHDQKRINNPEVGLVNPDDDADERETRYAWDPHIDPALQFDIGRADIERLIDDALATGDDAAMRAALQQLRRMSTPYLNWTGKAERTSFEVDTVSLHVHERIDPASILSALKKRLKPSSSRGGVGGNGVGEYAPQYQDDMFRAWFDRPLPLREAIEFYKHDRGWSNRLIAGDSLLVMNSLIQKESMAGQVQMIYIDPPYGIKYGSNFQPFTNKRDVKDRKDEDLTQEPEMIKAFRDTWELGIHSYLTYLRDRLLLAKDLLHESGSVFVQISDENIHLVRSLCDEIFGPSNFIAQITFRKTSLTFATKRLGGVADYVIWYCKKFDSYKYRTLFRKKQLGGDGASNYGFVEAADGSIRRLTSEEKMSGTQDRVFSSENLMSGGATPSCIFDFEYQAGRYSTVRGKSWKTNKLGMSRLACSNRLIPIGDQRLYFKTYLVSVQKP